MPKSKSVQRRKAAMKNEPTQKFEAEHNQPTIDRVAREVAVALGGYAIREWDCGDVQITHGLEEDPISPKWYSWEDFTSDHRTAARYFAYVEGYLLRRENEANALEQPHNRPQRLREIQACYVLREELDEAKRCGWANPLTAIIELWRVVEGEDA